ncbi:MAG: DUF2085 domain-containing protein [Anaerolineales bacterium]|nr:DUF2085 domain-containing protein [Anaerolineales bacterium]
MRATLFVRESCSLCEEAKEWLASLQDEYPHDLYVVNVDQDPTLEKKYGGLVPVLEAGPYSLQAPFTETEVRITLGALQEGNYEKPKLTDSQHNQAVFANKVLLQFSRHWLAVFNLFVFIFVGLPFLAPVLMKAGAELPGRVIYKVYSPLCHQLAFRSWFLFGEQPAYPLKRANTDFLSYEEVVGGTAEDLSTAHQYVGNEIVGYKVALCERDIAIYSGILLSGLLFAVVRKWLKPLPLWIWAVLGVAPMGLDGGSQLLAFVPFMDFPIRESTPLLRTITGLLFGIMNVWMAYPYLEEAMSETRALVLTKLARVRNQV